MASCWVQPDGGKQLTETDDKFNFSVEEDGIYHHENVNENHQNQLDVYGGLPSLRDEHLVYQTPNYETTKDCCVFSTPGPSQAILNRDANANNPNTDSNTSGSVNCLIVIPTSHQTSRGEDKKEESRESRKRSNSKYI